jgi:hypothetical protein
VCCIYARISFFYWQNCSSMTQGMKIVASWMSINERLLWGTSRGLRVHIPLPQNLYHLIYLYTTRQNNPQPVCTFCEPNLWRISFCIKYIYNCWHANQVLYVEVIDYVSGWCYNTCKCDESLGNEGEFITTPRFLKLKDVFFA